MREFATMGQQLARDQMCTGQHSTQTDLSRFGLLPAALCEHSLSPQHSTRLGKGLSRWGGWLGGSAGIHGISHLTPLHILYAKQVLVCGDKPCTKLPEQFCGFI